MKITQQLLEEMVKEQINEATLKDFLLGFPVTIPWGNDV